MSAAAHGAGDEPEVVEEPGEVLTVENDEGGEEEGAQRATDDAGRPSRKERRENRMAEERKLREEAERARTAAEERVARLEREHAELRGYVQASQQRQQEDPRAELAASITKLENEAEGHLERAAMARKAGDNDTYRREYAAYNAKMREATKLDAKADIRAELEAEMDRRLRQVPGITPQHLALRDTVMREFPWIATDEGARDMVDGEISRIARTGGRHPDDIAVIRQAATAVAKRLKLGGQQPVTREQQQRYTGTRGAEGGAAETDASRVVMGPREKKLARLSYPHLEQKEAEKAWAKMVSKSQSSDE